MENSSTKNKHDGMPVADVESEDKLPGLSLSQLKELHFVSEGLFYFVYRHKGQDQVVLFFAESFEDAKHRMAEMKMHSRLGGIVTGMEQDNFWGHLKLSAAQLWLRLRLLLRGKVISTHSVDGIK